MADATCVNCGDPCRRKYCAACAREGYLKAERAYNKTRPGNHRPAEGWLCGCGAPVNRHRQKCVDCRREVNRQRKRRERSSEAGRQGKQRENRRRKAARRGVSHEPYTLAEIAKRDRRYCGLCHHRVAMTKAVPHPKAPTIDHIVPLADGGDDIKANVRLAHFLCNSRRGARGGTEQLWLIG